MCCLHNSLRGVLPFAAICGAVAFCCKKKTKKARTLIGKLQLFSFLFHNFIFFCVPIPFRFLLLITNAEKCTICQKKLVDMRSLRWHVQTIHKQYVQNKRFECEECAFAHEKVTELETHMIQQRNWKHPRYCIYCNKFDVDNLKYMDHMNKNHGLPVWNADLENNPSSGILPSEHAFGGVLKTYDIPVGEQEIDLLSFMRSKQDNIENVVQLNTQISAKTSIQFIGAIKKTNKWWKHQQPARSNRNFC